MIIIDTPQGSLDWFIQRLWRLTASEMATNISAKTGALSKSEAARKAVDRCIAGITLANVMIARKDEFDHMDDRELGDFMSDYTGEKFFSNRHTERGHEKEHLAIAALSEKIARQIQPVGMCVMGDSEKGVVSCSPDGLVYDDDGKLISGAEVKAPCLCHYLRHVREGVLPSEYKLQVHASMVVCEVEHWHFASYCDEAGGPNKLFHVKVEWDKFTDKLQESLIQFQEVYREQYRETMEKLQELNEREQP